MENNEALKALIQGKPKVLHKNKNVYVILSECRVKIDGNWVDGVLYINEDLSAGPFVRVKSEFDEKFRLME